MEAELALVILLGRLQFEDSIKLRIYHIIKNGVDWYGVLNYCIKTNLLCIVYQNLISLGLLNLLPSIIKNNMHYHYISNYKRNQYLISESARINAFFKREKIQAIPVKGIKFLDTIYSAYPGIRILNDIDYIAVQSDRNMIHTYMKEHGFDTYLVNDQDAFCVVHSAENSHFYIKTTEDEFCIDLRVDFDYGHSVDFLTKIENDCLSEFFYLCCQCFLAMQEKRDLDFVEQFQFSKLVDICAYRGKFLRNLSLSEIQEKAAQRNCLEEVNYSFDCLKKIHMLI